MAPYGGCIVTTPIETSELDYVGDGIVTAFPITFPYLALDHIRATLTLDGETVATTLVFGVDYTLTPVGATGTLTMVAAPAVDAVLHIERTLPVTQPTAFRTQGNFSPRTHENSFDRLTHICQMLLRRLEAVETVVDAVPVSTYDASIIEEQFTTVDPASDTFPRTIALGTLNPTGVSVVRARNLTDGTASFSEGVFVSWSVVPDFGSLPATYDLVINNVTGLEPLKEYVLDLEILTVTPS